jgi:ferric-dicitrate binding protein FerR (iron transport regulator)
MEKKHLKELFKKYHDGTCTEEERALLETWYLQHNKNEKAISQSAINAAKNLIFLRLPGNHVAFSKIGIRMAAAAVLIGLVITVLFTLMQTGKRKSVKEMDADLPPGTNKAILTLGTGQKINLSDITNGKLASGSGIDAVKNAPGKLTFKLNAVNHADHSSTTISTPNGGEWEVQLADGTCAWLNSASSITFPTSFGNLENRLVTITGEVYFEVAKDPNHPFIVMARNQRVEVLGTHFNISSYKEDSAITTTLAEGRVKLSLLGMHDQVFLKPGHQAVASDQKIEVNEVDVNEALAWKNGYFQFNDEPINSAMQKLSRWYDFDFINKGPLPTDNINGKISRDKNLSQVLKALEATKTVHFKVEGRRITVMK